MRQKNSETVQNEVGRSFRSFISAVLIALAVATLILCVIKSVSLRIELARINDVNISLKAELHDAREENRRLSIKYEQSIELSELEEKAKNDLGMVKPGLRQVRSLGG